MRFNLLLAALLIVFIIPNYAQNRFVAAQHQDFFDWFHERSQVEQLYTDRSTLHVFSEQVNVRAKPSTRAAVVTQLPLGWAVTNVAYRQDRIPRATINGYEDIWYHVRGVDTEGRLFEGYIWGAHIAKGWRETDLTRNGSSELVMLGVSGQSRQTPQDISAEIRIVQSNRLISQAMVPGLCVFEECSASPMLRVLQSRNIDGLTVIEASTMTIGCLTGIDKAFFYWNGQQLERVYQAEYTTQTEVYRRQFTVKPTESNTSTMQLCEYGGEDSQYNPTWNCKAVQVVPPAARPVVALQGALAGGQ
ncbi:MAG TPA: SH3 domain-containing protein [Saprospiraceae bacterium]|nr:SH3 domain-containing protein [Saprospiraceae bacterium]HMP24983.1 SH3 domain-containing protein [Saprospiraceae bacterium]